jgi:CRISPR system Cascade subunit CasA
LEKEFNLIDESWILVLDKKGQTKELSIFETLEQAPDLIKLAGESVAQDFAMLRLLLAILHAVIGKREDGSYTKLGETRNPDSREGQLDRWKYLWEKKTLPIDDIEAYLREYYDRFYLFHPETPFYQMSGEIATQGSMYKVSKLNGNIVESSNSNTNRIFSNRQGDMKDRLSYSEAARWLLFLIGFDDTSLKKRVNPEKNSISKGWLGDLGLIANEGNNLFETLMLNLVLLRDADRELWMTERPVWQREPIKMDRVPVEFPDNSSEILTLQSRLVKLNRDEKSQEITGFYILGGNFYQKDIEVINEHMTIWKKGGNKSERQYQPKVNTPDKQAWRDLGSLLAAKVQDDEIPKPGVIRWVENLLDHDIDLEFIRLITAGVKYGGPPANEIQDHFSDSIGFSSELIKEKNLYWQIRIVNQVGVCDKLADYIYSLSIDLEYAKGNTGRSKDTVRRNKARAYELMDPYFREWLESIRPEEDDIGIKVEEWQDRAKKLIIKLGKTLVEEAGGIALVGREVDGKFYTSARAYNIFLSRVKNVSEEVI